MKKIMAVAAVLAVCLTLATPVMADHYRGRYVRGGSARVIRGGYYPVYRTHPYRYRSHASVFFGFGLPVVGFYAPAPVYYEPVPVVVAPPYCEPVWVPGHYVRDRGARVWIAGYWSR